MRNINLGIQIERIGHLGILVSDFERSLKYYTEVLGCKVTNILQRPDGSGRAFLCFDEWHHDFVVATAPAGVDVTKPEGRERLIQQISFVVKDRDAFLDALAHLHSHCIELVNSPVIHGPEGGQTENILGSGSHAIYFLDPDGNREEFPRPDIATALKAYTSR
jgi:catechol 2,3-dioxygenase-like lactoylglutathione lyase family enzyme